MRLKLLLSVINLGMAVALLGLPQSFAAEQSSDVPAWLRSHVGEGPSQIAQVVLQRARALYLQKVGEGVVRIHATSPWTLRGLAVRGGGSTLYAKPIGPFARFQRATATGVI